MRFIYTRAFGIAFAIFVSIALLVIFDAKGYLGFIKSGFARAYGYSTSGVSGTVGGTKNFFETLFTIRGLVHENASLKQKINELSFENARLLSSKQENLALRKTLNFKDASDFNLVAVETIGADPTGFSQVILVNKGAADGINENSAVIVAPGLLVGKVTKVYNSTSEVTLITDPSIIINAKVADSDAHGLIQGEHGLGLSFGLISQNEVIKTQDQVITSGLAGDFPAGILVGQINSINSSSADLFQRASVAPAADLRNLRFLFVIK